jgi:hypothetical protein
MGKNACEVQVNNAVCYLKMCDNLHDVTWNILKTNTRNEHLKDLYRNDKDIQEMIK